MRRFAVFITTIIFATVFISQAQLTEPAKNAPQASVENQAVPESIQKEYPLVPTRMGPEIDEGSYSPRDENWILRLNRSQRLAELGKAAVIVGILLTAFCIFMVTGAADLEWEKKLTKENVPSDP